MDDLENKSLTPQEVAEILKISKCTVYELIKRKDLNGYRVGNKVRVDMLDVEEYKNKSKSIKTKKSGNPEQAQPERAAAAELDSNRDDRRESFTICGQDSLLDILCRHLGRHPRGVPALRSYESSYNALYSLYRGDANVAAAHIWDGKTGDYNIPYVERMLPGIPSVIIRLAARMQGIYVLKGNPRKISGFEDLGRKNISIINREPGSGSRILLDEYLKKLGISISKIKGYENESNSPMGLTSAIAKGHADMAVGLELPFLKIRQIDFIPAHKEYYDVVIKKAHIDQPIYQAILDIMKSEDFKMEMHGINGYDLTDCGKIIAET
ncbi:helix-turn-helix transcriptional regulator [Ruminiclostridium hungatei]|uniref:helix-turn-helix transcriptional regulator n=1 Tax=Ruminiclostridium hungatei TaxID=48256 RepID=UPI0030EE6E09